MCYSVYLSTTSSEDLSKRSSDWVRFEKLEKTPDASYADRLAFPNRWYVGSKSGCSCTFRHLFRLSIELGFSEPVDWYPEGSDEIEATKELYAVLAHFTSGGFEVDLIDDWGSTPPEALATVEVSLSDVSAGAFRLFEDHRFIFKK